MAAKRIAIGVIAFVMVLVSGSHAFAAADYVNGDPNTTYTSDDTFANENSIFFLSDTYSATCSNSAVAGSVTTDQGNIATAYNFFVKKGLSALAASAIVGNLRQESGVNPTIQNGIGAYGLAQWLNGRKSALQSMPNYNTLNVQLNYIWTELNGGYKHWLDILRNPPTQDPSALAILFGGGPQGYGSGYEGYGKTEAGSRGEYAKQLFEQYGNGGASTGTASSCNNKGSASFTYYSQTDPKWASAPYGTGTVGVNGCGPTSLAMIIATFFNSSVTPDQIAALGAANGSYDPQVGTIHKPLLDAASKKYGFTYTDLSGADISQLESYVQQGGLIYMSGSGTAPFTTGGHIVVMRGVTSDGQIIIADPYRGQTDTYAPSVVAAQMKTVYGITKTTAS